MDSFTSVGTELEESSKGELEADLPSPPVSLFLSPSRSLESHHRQLRLRCLPRRKDLPSSEFCPSSSSSPSFFHLTPVPLNSQYDDTNPSAEEGRYFESILEMVRWLGFEPWTITYSSDHFQRLYDLATELIRRDKAYVCHCTGSFSSPLLFDASTTKRSPLSSLPLLHRSQPRNNSSTEEARNPKPEPLALIDLVPWRSRSSSLNG